MIQIAQIIVEDAQVILKTPYNPGFVNELKIDVGWTSRGWDPMSKTWWVDPVYKKYVIDLCRRYFADVEVVDKTTPQIQAGIDPQADWADVLFDATPEHLHAKLFKKLALVLHPDQGGDLEAMKVLTEAYARRQAP